MHLNLRMMFRLSDCGNQPSRVGSRSRSRVPIQIIAISPRELGPHPEEIIAISLRESGPNPEGIIAISLVRWVSILKGLQQSAQRCEERATLGQLQYKPSTLKGLHRTSQSLNTRSFNPLQCNIRVQTALRSMITPFHRTKATVLNERSPPI